MKSDGTPVGTPSGADSRKLLLILADGLPYWKVDENLTPFLAAAGSAPLEPGIGFSVNLYVELFAGRQADEIGFFNKWGLKDPESPVDPPAVKRWLARLADLSRVNFALSRIVHKVAERWGRSGPIGNVPFQLMPYLKANPKEEIFGDAPYPTVFSVGEWDLHIGSDVPRPFSRRDEVVVERARASIAAGEKHVFAALTDIDAISHAMGMRSSFDWVGFTKGVRISLDEHIRKVDAWCRELTEAFVERHGDDAAVVIVSDHGMGPVDPQGRVDLGLERRFGRPGADSYLYMLDSTMMRLWVWDDALYRPMLEYLEGQGDGVVLSEDQRREFGISTPAFGHAIFLLDEGKIFFPNFFGGRFPKAMHGWHPSNPTQLGVCACPTPDVDHLPTHARDVYGFCRRLIEGQVESQRPETAP